MYATAARPTAPSASQGIAHRTDRSLLCASFFGQSAVFVEPIDSVSLLSRTKRYFCIGDRNDYVVLDGGRDCVDQKPRPSCRGCFCKRTVMRLSHFRCVRRVTSTWHRLLFLPRGSAQDTGTVGPPELFRPRDQCFVAGNLIVFHGKRRSDQRCVEHFFVVDVGNDVASSITPSIAGKSIPLASTPCILNTCSSRLT
jgi:hypothetical protein